MAKDPVCDMDVEENNAPGTSEYQDHTYYFCSLRCNREFDDHPERYATAVS